MPQRLATRRHPRLAAVGVVVLLGMQVLAVPARAVGPAVAVDVNTGDTQVHVGDVIKYTFGVTNPGDTVLKVGAVSGTLCDSEPSYATGDAGNPGLLETGETWIYDCPHAVVEAEHVISNVANVTAAPPGDVLPDVTASDNVDVEVLHPAISVDVTLGEQVLVGDKIVYRFFVGNPGDTPINQVVIVTDICLTPIVSDGADDGNDGWIAPDAMESWGYRCDGPIVGAADTAFHAAADVRGSDALGKIVQASGSGDAIVIHPSMTFTNATKQTTAHPGDTITFTYKLANTGDTYIDTLVVTTTACDDGTLKYGDDGVHFAVYPGLTWTGSCTHKVTEKVGATVTNVFGFGAWGGIHFEYSAQASVKIVAKAVATPTAAPTEVPSVEPSASPAPSVEPSDAPSAAAPTATPLVATPAPTIAPAPVSAAGSGLPILPIVIVLVVVGVTVGGWLFWQRRRLTSAGGGGGGGGGAP